MTIFVSCLPKIAKIKTLKVFLRNEIGYSTLVEVLLILPGFLLFYEIIGLSDQFFFLSPYNICRKIVICWWRQISKMNRKSRQNFAPRLSGTK